jgi:hypothetical protein
MCVYCNLSLRRFETPEERAAREAEIDRRLRAAEGIPSPRGGSASGRWAANS